MRERLIADLPASERRLDVDGVTTSVLEGATALRSSSCTGSARLHSSGGESSRSSPGAIGSSPLDLPGLGESAKHAGRLDASTAAAWLQNLIAQTCAEAPIIVGHSVGGAVAVHLAIQHQSSVRRIVLVDCSSLGRFPAGARAGRGARPVRSAPEPRESRPLLAPGARRSRSGSDGVGCQVGRARGVRHRPGNTKRRGCGQP
jgi:hypothetical protein